MSLLFALGYFCRRSREGWLPYGTGRPDICEWLGKSAGVGDDGGAAAAAGIKGVPLVGKPPVVTMLPPTKHLLLLASLAALAATQVLPILHQQQPPPVPGLRGRVRGGPQCHRGSARLGRWPSGRSLWLRVQLRPAGRRLRLLRRCEQRVQGLPHLRPHLWQRGVPGQDGQVQLCVWGGNPVRPVHPHVQLPRCNNSHILPGDQNLTSPSLFQFAFPCEESPSLYGAVEFGKIPDDYWAHRKSAVQSKVNTCEEVSFRGRGGSINAKQASESPPGSAIVSLIASHIYRYKSEWVVPNAFPCDLSVTCAMQCLLTIIMWRTGSLLQLQGQNIRQ